MLRTCAILLTAFALFASPSTAFANCPATMPTAARLNCLNTSLNAAVADIDTLQTANAALRDQVDALEASRIPGLTARSGWADQRNRKGNGAWFVSA